MYSNRDLKYGLCAVALALTCVTMAARTILTIPDNAEVEIGHSEAVTNDTAVALMLGDNVTFRLTADGTGSGLFDFKPVVHCTNGFGRITVDATAAASAGFTGIRWYNHVRATGGITVKGLDKIVFGTDSKCDGATTDANTYLDTLFTFAEASGIPLASPAGITVTNGVLIGVKQTCPLVPAANVWIWPYGENSYGTPGETLDITGYNLGIVSANGIAAAAVKVPAGSRLSARPCVLQYESKQDIAYFYKWGGSPQVVNKNVILDGGSFYIKSTPNYTHAGTITGSGSLLFEGGKTGVGTFSAADFTGAVTNNGYRLVFSGSSDCSQNSFVFTAANSTYPTRTLSFQPSGSQYSSAMTVGPITGNHFDSNLVEVPGKQTITVSSVSGRLGFTRSGADATVKVNNLATSAIVGVQDGMELHLFAQDTPNNKVVPRNTQGSNRWTICGPATGTRVNIILAQVPANANFTFGGLLNVTSIPADVASVTILDGADVTGDIPAACPVTSLGGKWSVYDWHDKIDLWCDATAADSFTYVTELNPDATIGDHKIFRWCDRRPEQRDYSFVMSRFKPTETASLIKYETMYPAVTNDTTLGGKKYVKCSFSSQTRMGMLDPDTPINGQNGNAQFSFIDSRYAIVVARNISTVRGEAMLCCSNGTLAASKPGNDAYVFTNENITAYRDGAGFDPTATKFGSNWHLYSFTTEGAPINGLCNATNAANNQAAGGFDYAEIMIFGTMPTDDERKMAEEYLSAKWGIAVPHSGTAQEISLSGRGETTLPGPSRMGGAFGGTIDLGGYSLDLINGRKTITAADIPSENRSLWVDPSLSSSLMMSEEAGKSDEVAAAFSRDAAGRDSSARWYLQSAYDPTGTTNRRPRLVTAPAGGPAVQWFDFLDGYGDNDRNNLMFRTLPWREPIANYADITSPNTFTSVDYKTIIMVIDSSRGGGSPFLHYAGGGNTGNRGYNPTPATPIFKDCTDTFTNATVHLDGVPVTPDPAHAGFTGKPEVYTCELPEGATSQVKAFAFCGYVNNYYNQEKIGEILVYNTTLDSAVRSEIEVYLMKKWFGRVPAGYSDFSDLTITGAGTLKAPSIAAMPNLAAGFTGDVTVSTNRLAFTFASGATVANEAISAANTAFTLPNAVTVDLTFAAKPSAGRYTLFTANVQNAVTWSIGELVNARADRTFLVWDAAAKTLYADIRPAGTFIIMR